MKWSWKKPSPFDWLLLGVAAVILIVQVYIDTH